MINFVGTFECQCPDNSTGKDCDNKISDCFTPDKCLEVAQDGTCNVCIKSSLQKLLE